jgi:hypothetical protein
VADINEVNQTLAFCSTEDILRELVARSDALVIMTSTPSKDGAKEQCDLIFQPSEVGGYRPLIGLLARGYAEILETAAHEPETLACEECIAEAEEELGTADLEEEADEEEGEEWKREDDSSAN